MSSRDNDVKKGLKALEKIDDGHLADALFGLMQMQAQILEMQKELRAEREELLEMKRALLAPETKKLRATPAMRSAALAKNAESARVGRAASRSGLSTEAWRAWCAENGWADPTKSAGPTERAAFEKQAKTKQRKAK